MRQQQLTSLQLCLTAMLTDFAAANDNETDLPEHLTATNTTNTNSPTPQAIFLTMFLFIVFFTCLIEKLFQLERHFKSDNRFFRKKSTNKNNSNKEKQKPLIYRTV